MTDFLVEQKDLKGLNLALQNAYKNIICNLVRLSLDDRITIDPLALSYVGIDNIKPDFNYLSLLETTSYFSSSQGGRGSLVEKTISHLIEAEVGKYIQDLVPDSSVNEKFDIIKVTPKRLLLIEVKNRVDSGGTAGRKEALNKFINVYKNSKLDDIDSPFKKIDMIFGALYNTKGSSATFEDDKSQGFQGESIRIMKESFNEESLNENNLTFIKQRKSKFTITTKYGDDFTNFVKSDLKVQNIHDLLFPKKWQDLKIALTTAIEQRSLLLLNKNNLFTLFQSFNLTGSISEKLEKIKEATKIHFIYEEEYLKNCIILHNVYQKRIKHENDNSKWKC